MRLRNGTEQSARGLSQQGRSILRVLEHYKIYIYIGGFRIATLHHIQPDTTFYNENIMYTFGKYLWNIMEH